MGLRGHPNRARGLAVVESRRHRRGSWLADCADEPSVQAPTAAHRATALKGLRSSVRRTSRERCGGRLQCARTTCRQALGPRRRLQTSGCFNLALSIGREVAVVFAIVAVSFRHSNPLWASLQHAALGKTRVLVRHALFRAQRRGGSAAHRQRLSRRGASLHRIHGVASQALQRGPVARPQARYRAFRRPWSAPVLILRGGAPSFKRPLSP